jgi:hypothetical protein
MAIVGTNRRSMATIASAALTAATSSDTPYTPTMLANCAIGSVDVWL